MSNPYALLPTSTQPPGAEDAPRPASAVWASILSLFALGSGHVYAGCARRGLGYMGASIVAAIAWGALIRPSYLALGLFGILAPGLLPLGVYLHGVLDAGKRAPARVRRVPVWIVVVAFAALWWTRSLVTLGVRTFFVEAFRVPSGSVVPTLVYGDHIFTDKLTPRLRPPRRGELIIFPFPEHPDQHFVKRVVGLPGDSLQVGEGDELIINGWHVPRCKVGQLQYRDETGARSGDVWMEFLGESSYLVLDDAGSPREGGEWRVAPGQAFVMGDNRNNSHDSRMWYSGQGGGVPLGTVRAFPLTVWLSTNAQGRSDSTRMGADLTGRDPLAPAGMADAVAKCLAGRPKGSVGPPS
jgi:signal peptidase I